MSYMWIIEYYLSYDIVCVVSGGICMHVASIDCECICWMCCIWKLLCM